MFGEPNTPFSFNDFDAIKTKHDLDELKERSKELENVINTRAMSLLGTAEEQCRELEKKRQQLEKDKNQLYGVIEKLDEKKQRELIIAHEKISQVNF